MSYNELVQIRRNTRNRGLNPRTVRNVINIRILEYMNVLIYFSSPKGPALTNIEEGEEVQEVPRDQANTPKPQNPMRKFDLCLIK